MFIKAKILAHSRPWWATDTSNDIITYQLQYHRFIHSELMTHRVFSRNASSSRAVPREKQIEQIKNNVILPVHWGINRPGMQAKQELDADRMQKAFETWLSASEQAVMHARQLSELNVHKQLVNRITEPFSTINVVVTSTEWDNFFSLRVSKAAQPEIEELAYKMLMAKRTSTPTILREGEMHLPYMEEPTGEPINYPGLDRINIKQSVARTARVTHKRHGSGEFSTPEADAERYQALLDMKHMSPFEHQAICIEKPVRPITFMQGRKGITHVDKKLRVWSNNFRGWIQYRALLAEEIGDA